MTQRTSVIRWLSGAAGVLLLFWLPPTLQGQPPERLPDKDVKEIIGSVNQTRDRFEDQLDSKLKSSILRGDRGEVNVSAYLDDLQENVTRLKDRFTKDYGASKEAETVLRQCSDIHRFMQTQKEFQGRSEWDAMTNDLRRLASAYNTEFPLPADAAVRRINDGEIATTADAIVKGSNDLKKQLDKEATLPKPDRDAAKKDIDAVSNQAKTVKSRVQDSKPATAEVRQLFQNVEKVGGFMNTHTALQPDTVKAWGVFKAPLERMQQAFGFFK